MFAYTNLLWKSETLLQTDDIFSVAKSTCLYKQTSFLNPRDDLINITWSNTVFPGHSFYQLSLVIESCRVSPLLPEVLPISFDSRESQWFRNRRVRFRANIRKAFVVISPFFFSPYLQLFLNSLKNDQLLSFSNLLYINWSWIFWQLWPFTDNIFLNFFIHFNCRLSRNKEKYEFIALYVNLYVWLYDLWETNIKFCCMYAAAVHLR